MSDRVCECPDCCWEGPPDKLYSDACPNCGNDELHWTAEPEGETTTYGKLCECLQCNQEFTTEELEDDVCPNCGHTEFSCLEESL